MEGISPALIFEFKVVASDVDAIRRKLDERKLADMDDLGRHLDRDAEAGDFLLVLFGQPTFRFPLLQAVDAEDTLELVVGLIALIQSGTSAIELFVRRGVLLTAVILCCCRHRCPLLLSWNAVVAP